MKRMTPALQQSEGILRYIGQWVSELKLAGYGVTQHNPSAYYPVREPPREADKILFRIRWMFLGRHLASPDRNRLSVYEDKAPENRVRYSPAGEMRYALLWRTQGRGYLAFRSGIFPASCSDIIKMTLISIRTSVWYHLVMKISQTL
jgi:hypothetical protein